GGGGGGGGGGRARAGRGGGGAGEGRVDETRRSAERRRPLCGLENAEPATRAGADEEEAAAAAERRDDRVHGRRDLAPDARHRAHGPAILAVHQCGDLERREAVEGAARAVLPLGGEPRVVNSRRRHVRMLLLSG